MLENAKRGMRARATERVLSISRMPLPIQVQTNIEEKLSLPFQKSETKMLYVDLKAIAEPSAIVEDNEKFEIFKFILHCIYV